ncbi:MAG: tRNA lysidine(34) synthetase TilS [Bifidobacteriaceae bacterium]|jgi:tRNA(Ile)-lysidine synthase|nr:tRNA lysidine(34) synthetase TilS [Bifidobacteriaceae bacterium]
MNGRPDPAVAAGRVAVRRWLAQQAVVPDGAPSPLLLVACSGGADSLALAAAAAFEAPRAGWRAGAVVIDHGLQSGSAAVAARAVAQCRDLGLDPVESRRVAVDRAAGNGVEAAAREARYAGLAEAAADQQAGAVLLAHTMDDQAETVLLALARGSGPRALAGMAPARDLFHRPFLGLRRADTEAACQALGLEPWQDPTNRPGGPLPSRRAEVRATLLPVAIEVLGPGLVPALARTAEGLRQDQDYLDTQAAALLAAAQAAAPRPRAQTPQALDAKTLAQAHPALRHRALHQAAQQWGAAAGSLTHAHVAALDALVTAWHGQGPAALPGVAIGRWNEGGQALIGPQTT